MLSRGRRSGRSTGAATNASLIAKNRYGWSQFMQWESNGLRIGSRSTTTGGSGEVHITSGSDAVSLKIDGSGRVTKPLQPAFRAGRSSNYSPGAGSDIIFNTVRKNFPICFKVRMFKFTFI